MNHRARVAWLGGLGLMLLIAGCGEGVAGNQRQISRGGGVTDGTQLPGSSTGEKPGQPAAPSDNLPLVRDLAVSGGYGYAVVPDGLVVIDVNDPSQPKTAASRVVARTPLDLAVSDLHAFIACGDGGLQVVSISRPREPSVVGSYAPQNGGVTCVAASDNVAVAGIPGVGAAVLDIGDPAQPREVKLVAGQATIESVTIAGRRAFVSADKLVIIGLDPPAQAEIVATHESTEPLLGLGFAADRLVVADAGGYRLLNALSPANLITVGQVEQAAVVTALAGDEPEPPAEVEEPEPTVVEEPTDEDQAAEPDAPAEPAPDVITPTPAPPTEVPAPPRLAVADGHLYRTDGDEGVWVLAIDGGRRLNPVAHLTDVGRASCVAAAGDLLLVGNAAGDVIVFRWVDNALTRQGSLRLESLRSTAAPAGQPASVAPEPAGLQPEVLPGDEQLGGEARRPGPAGAPPS